ncbi:MAG: hypothetical protein WD875_00960 [Pirellulales bacterium]
MSQIFADEIRPIRLSRTTKVVGQAKRPFDMPSSIHSIRAGLTELLNNLRNVICENLRNLRIIARHD